MEIAWCIYVNTAAGLLDIAPDPEVGACGSNWQFLGYTREQAEEWLERELVAGWERGHMTSPRF